MNLKYLKPLELDHQIKSLAFKEREVLVEILNVIKEIDARKTYLELGFPSLFSYLTEGVGYSEGSAQRRIDAARLIKEIPEVSDKIQSGELKLAQVSMVQKAAREAQKSNPSFKAKKEEKRDLLNSLVSKNHQNTQKQVAAFFELPILRQSHQSIQRDKSVRLEFTLSEAQFRDLEKAQELLSHCLKSKELPEFLQYVCEKIIRQKSPSLRQHQKSSSKKISSLVKKEIFQQNQGCQYVEAKTGKKCNSRWFLQVDHKQSLWTQSWTNLKQIHDPQNLQILCAHHNQMKYRKEAGITLKS